MRDGKSPEVALILDEIPELEILKQDLEVRPQGFYTAEWCRLDLEESLPGRFLSQSRVGGEATPFYISDSGAGWQDEPTFEILAWDVEAVMNSAKKVIENRKFTDRFKADARERNIAAEGIMRELGNYKVSNPDPPEGPSSGAIMMRW